MRALLSGNGRLPSMRALTLRTRLTVLYSTAFAAAGTTLVVILCLVASASLDRQPVDVVAVALTREGTDTEIDLGQLVEWGPPQDAGPRGGEPLEDIATSAGSPLGEWLGPPRAGPLRSPDQPRQADETSTPIDEVGFLSFSERVAEVNEDARDQTLRTIVVWSVGTLLVTLLGAIAVGWLMASRVLAPLHSVTATARRVAGHSLTERIALDGPQDEIKDLADTFDEMLDRLDASFDGQRRFTANASHELRTPLTITRSVLEVAVSDPGCPPATRELAEKLLTVNHRQGALIESLLALASADLTPPEKTPVDLFETSRQVAEELRPAASAAQVELVVCADRPPEERHGCGCGDAEHGERLVDADRVLLERLVRNLVENAIRYNTAGGTVQVCTPCAHELVVANTGQVVPPKEVAGLFEPFRRLASDGTVADRAARSTRHPGSGLGLSIVRSIVEAHSGTVSAESRDGGGLVVRALLPGGCRADHQREGHLSPDSTACCPRDAVPA